MTPPTRRSIRISATLDDFRALPVPEEIRLISETDRPNHHVPSVSQRHSATKSGARLQLNGSGQVQRSLDNRNGDALDVELSGAIWGIGR